MGEFPPSRRRRRREGRHIERFRSPSCRPPIVARTKGPPAARGSMGRRHRGGPSSLRYTARIGSIAPTGPKTDLWQSVLWEPTSRVWVVFVGFCTLLDPFPFPPHC